MRDFEPVALLVEDVHELRLEVLVAVPGSTRHASVRLQIVKPVKKCSLRPRLHCLSGADSSLLEIISLATRSVRRLLSWRCQQFFRPLLWSCFKIRRIEVVILRGKVTHYLNVMSVFLAVILLITARTKNIWTGTAWLWLKEYRAVINE